jgi:hypothetical protein
MVGGDGNAAPVSDAAIAGSRPVELFAKASTCDSASSTFVQAGRVDHDIIA